MDGFWRSVPTLCVSRMTAHHSQASHNGPHAMATERRPKRWPTTEAPLMSDPIRILPNTVFARTSKRLFEQAIASCLALIGLGLISPAVAEDSATVDFVREVRPILSDHCFACHGPDQHKREADLRLDQSEGVESVIDGEFHDRITSDDPELIMPPPTYNKPLTADQIAILNRWIKAGGKVQSHWAFVPPKQSPVTSKADVHAIAVLIAKEIKAQGLKVGPRADDLTLLRRATLALTGLPPTRQQIQAVKTGKLNYETLVDELLASPSFGQHWGRQWLDLVRYGDTHGLHLDNYREMWPYRDWVIEAINQNMPFDQFITEQLAGDLLPNATLKQQIASGFNRLNVTTSEGGSIYDEVFARNVIDRTDAFGTIFLGLTTQCAVCHDHKFDPITQQDYYSLSAFFNSLDGRALDGNKKDHPPVVKVPTTEQTEQIKQLTEQIADYQTEKQGDLPTVDAAQVEWENQLAAKPVEKPSDEPAADPVTLKALAATSQAGKPLHIDEETIVRSGKEIADKDTHSIVLALPAETDQSDWGTALLSVIAEPTSNRVGRASNGNAVLTEITFETARVDDDAEPNADVQWHSLKISQAVADYEQPNGKFALSYAIDGKRVGDEGWAVGGHEKNGGRSAAFGLPELTKRLQEGANRLRVRLEYQSIYGSHQFHAVKLDLAEGEPEVPQEWVELGPLQLAGPFAAESAQAAYGRNVAAENATFDPNATFRDGEQEIKWQLAESISEVKTNALPYRDDGVTINVFYQSLKSPKAQSIDLLLGSSDATIVFLNKKRIADVRRTGPMKPLANTYKLDLVKGDNHLFIKTITSQRDPMLTYAFRSPALPVPESIRQLVATARDERSELQKESLRTYYRQVHCDHEDWTALQDLIAGSQKAKQDIENKIATTLVWKELAKPRQAHVLMRGQYDQPGDSVPREVPAFLPSMPDSAPKNRLGLARWLTTPENPLTARVAVNRFWQVLMGTGIVRSSEDFGSQGEPPSHQELLDHLALEFQAGGWDVKALLKQIVTSETFCRDAKVDPANHELDPANRYFARGPRFRLDAEVLRDQSLALSGLLNLAFSGPSVKPPQPKGLWYAVGYTRSDTANFVADQDPEKQFRRSVYIFWKRTSAPPTMSTFDAPSRENCTARRERTNTPLQALLLMNEQQYLQSAKHLAHRALTTNDVKAGDDAQRITWLFETVTTHPPSDHQLSAALKLLEQMRSHYGEQAELTTGAATDLLAVDKGEIAMQDAAEHAAWMMLCSALLNLDQVVNQ